VTTTEKDDLPGIAWPAPEWTGKVDHHRIVVSLLLPDTLPVPVDRGGGAGTQQIIQGHHLAAKSR